MKTLSLILSVALSIVFINQPTCAMSKIERIQGALLGGLIGDCLGKPTEFINSIDKQFAQFPDGIKNSDDLKKHNLCLQDNNGKRYAPYTDDTAMAILTLIVLETARKRNWILQQTMRELAMYYTEDCINHPAWHDSSRAPGNACLKAMKEIMNRYNQSQAYNEHGQRVFDYYAGDLTAMGCGSVMRAHPFGIIFADNPEKAATWAAEHSKITHGHPAAQAACAAFAVGIAYAIQGKNKDFIIAHMIAWAKKYDSSEFRMNAYSHQLDLSTWKKIEHAVSHAQSMIHASPCNPEITPYVPDTNRDHSNINFQIHYSKPLFEKYLGWAADDAIAAAIYLFALPNDCAKTIFLGVHTQGDSDSIASIAGALMGALRGSAELFEYYRIADFEGNEALQKYAQSAATLLPII